MFCLHCGHTILVEPSSNPSIIFCPACGQKNLWGSPAAASISDNPASLSLWKQHRRRWLLFTALWVALFLALMIWLLIHPSTNGSFAHRAKQIIFGGNVAAAADQLRHSLFEGQGRSGQSSQDHSQSETESPPAEGETNESPDSQGNQSSPNDADASATSRSQSSNASDASRDSGHQGNHEQRNANIRTSRNRNQEQGGGDSPANVQLPNRRTPSLEAPAPRSVGEIQGTGATRPNTGSLRPGLGGTGTNRTGMGSTNLAPLTPGSRLQDSTNITLTNDSLGLQLPQGNTNRRPRPDEAIIDDLLARYHAGSGDVRISLMWNNMNDLDLHVIDPRGEEINYSDRRSASGGLLDIDMNASPPYKVPAVENVYWPQQAAPPGVYQVYVNHFRTHGSANETAFTVCILIRGQSNYYRGRIRFGEPKKLIHQFTLIEDYSTRR